MRPEAVLGSAQDNGDLRTSRLVVSALGVVFGDLVTSPLYTMRECFYGAYPVPPTRLNILGVASLVVWSLLLVISLKYLLFVMRADNKGEGGVVALAALLNPWRARRASPTWWLMLLGLFGGALLYGDGTITPAISVLSALEGLEVAAPALHNWIIPVVMLILVGLFLLQQRGTARVGAMFGPILILWLVVIAALGVRGILMEPQVLMAINPWYGVRFFLHHGLPGYLVLGGVFLCLTGAEALYADMGHFGRMPIRLAWFWLALPALLLNYFGQAAVVLHGGGHSQHQPFYELAPSWALYPLVALAAVATIIASQAVIAGAFSLTRQLVSLGQLPLVKIIQTSADEQGQIYVPAVNWMMMLATLGLVLGFKTSNALAAAYGIAVSATMVLIFFVSRHMRWPRLPTTLLCATFLAIDLAFLGANVFKILNGGWYPLLVAAGIFVVMTTWARGRTLLRQQLMVQSEPLSMLVKSLEQDPPHRILGTAVFLTGEGKAPARLMRHLELHHVLQEHLLLVTVETEDTPRVPADERMTLFSMAPGINRVILRYGFMQQPNLPIALKLAEKLGLEIDTDEITYYVGRETLIPDVAVAGMALWRERLFSFLSRNARPATAYYGLPPENVVELGFRIRV
jgi:KUP system potassium uptake protein